VSTTSNPCNARPWFVGDTPPQGQTRSTITGAPFTFSVYAKPSTEAEKWVHVFVFWYNFNHNTNHEQFSSKDFL